MSTETTTEGARAFAAVIEERSLTLQQVGVELGVSSIAVLDWRRGRRRPGKHCRDRIQIWSAHRIEPDAWDTENERAQIAALRERLDATGAVG